jgi:hypothetical protein
MIMRAFPVTRLVMTTLLLALRGLWMMPWWGKGVLLIGTLIAVTQD